MRLLIPLTLGFIALHSHAASGPRGKFTILHDRYSVSTAIAVETSTGHLVAAGVGSSKSSVDSRTYVWTFKLEAREKENHWEPVNESLLNRFQYSTILHFAKDRKAELEGREEYLLVYRTSDELGLGTEKRSGVVLQTLSRDGKLLVETLVEDSSELNRKVFKTFAQDNFGEWYFGGSTISNTTPKCERPQIIKLHRNSLIEQIWVSPTTACEPTWGGHDEITKLLFGNHNELIFSVYQTKHQTNKTSAGSRILALNAKTKETRTVIDLRQYAHEIGKGVKALGPLKEVSVSDFNYDPTTNSLRAVGRATKTVYGTYDETEVAWVVSVSLTHDKLMWLKSFDECRPRARIVLGKIHTLKDQSLLLGGSCGSFQWQNSVAMFISKISKTGEYKWARLVGEIGLYAEVESIYENSDGDIIGVGRSSTNARPAVSFVKIPASGLEN